MKKKILKSAIIAGAGIAIFSGAALADAINPNRPFDNGELGTGQNGFLEDRLQEIFNNTVSGGSLDSVNDQSSNAVWTAAEAVVDSYLITMLTAQPGTLGIYSFTTGAEYAFPLIFDAASFAINNFGSLFINGGLADVAFGDSFGFYYDNYGSKNYTEDSKNGGDIRAITYLVASGLQVDTAAFGGLTVNATGDNDWILAFEDGTDYDFQDGVFYIEDIDPAGGALDPGPTAPPHLLQSGRTQPGDPAVAAAPQRQAVQKAARQPAKPFSRDGETAARAVTRHPYELAHWKKATVHLDYHVEVEGHYYSVPFTLAGKQLEIRFTARTV